MSYPFLTKVQLATYNSARVPTTATVTFYSPGASVTVGTTLLPYSYDNAVEVNDTATLTVGDQVTLGSDGPVLPVVAINGPTEIMFDNATGTAIVLTTGMRLLRAAAPPPRLYSSRGGPLISGNAITTHAVTGRGTVFVEADRFDYTVEVAGQPKRIAADALGGRFRSEIDWNDVRDFPSIQAAIDALPEAGGVVYLPTGLHDLSAALLIARENVALVGAGLGTVIRPDGNNIDAFDLLTIRAGRCRISDLSMDGRAGATGAQSCLVIEGPAVLGGNIDACHLENLMVTQAPKYGLRVTDALNTLVVNCEFVANRGDGVRLDKTSTGVGVNGARFLNCIFNGNTGSGVVAYDAAGLTFYGCDFETNKGGSGATQGNALEAHGCKRVEVYSCYIEDADTPATAGQFILLDDCPNAIVDSCWFQGNLKPPSRAVRFTSSPWSRLTNNAAHHCGELALFDANSNDSVEFGNRDAAGPSVLPKFTFEGSVRVLGLSRAALGLYTYPDDDARGAPTAMREGSMIWVKTPGSGNTKLQISDGTAWKDVTLT